MSVAHLQALRSWLAPPTAVARVAVLRRVLAVFVLADMAFLTNDVVPHATGSQVVYQPLLLRRMLDLPTPSPGYAHALEAVLVVSALVVALGRAPRAAGWVLALAFLDWVSIAFSYAKIDHDHVALVLALFVLPTAGPARLRSRATSEAAGFAVRCIQVACVSVYFLSAVSKMRFGGWDWATGATFAWAMTRRGTQIGDLLARSPLLLQASQWGVLAMETLTPLLVVVRARRAMVGALVLVGFHLATWLTTGIHFLPLVVCLLAFVPLEDCLPVVPGPAGRSRGRVLRPTATPRPAGSGSPRAAAGAPASARPPA